MAETQDVRKGPVGPGLEQYAGLDGALECGLQRGGNQGFETGGRWSGLCECLPFWRLD